MIVGAFCNVRLYLYQTGFQMACVIFVSKVMTLGLPLEIMAWYSYLIKLGIIRLCLAPIH
jgi:hypothetical protein